MTPDQIIEVVTAFKNGKKIESRNKVIGGWTDSNPDWNFFCFDYRVKPEPMELWVNVYESGDHYVYTAKEKALLHAHKHCLRKAVLFREVIGADVENGDK